MSEERTMIVPPFAGVMLVEYRDRFEFSPYEWVREFVGYGRVDAKEVKPRPGSLGALLFQEFMGDGEIWAVGCWHRFEDGREKVLRVRYLDASATEEDARKQFESEKRFTNMSKEQLERLGKCFKQTEDDLAYVENRFPGLSRGPPQSGSVDERDVYQARLKVLAGFQPKTVELILRAEGAASDAERSRIEREAVQAYFADLAHYWTEDLVKEWQRSNPVGTDWLCRFAEVFREPKREIEPINHELALNWLRRKYNLLTAEELSDAILVATGQRIPPATLKKRRERLGLTTKRPPGPKPNSEQ